jgi:hypothetical protein
VCIQIYRDAYLCFSYPAYRFINRSIHFLKITIMAKQFLLFANKEIDTDLQTVSVNQVVQMEGYSYPKYIVYKITKDQWGIDYKLINLRDYSFDTTSLIRPLSEKFGTGIYYDDKNPQFKTDEEVAELLAKAQIKLKRENEEAERKKTEREMVEAIGKEWLEKHLPEDAQGVIVGRLRQNESDSQTDYYAHSTQRTVILGFSTHKRDIFSEMRKHASNFEGTACLAEYNADYEHREKYSMGDGYYLGESKYSGWIIEKYPIHNRDNAIKEFSFVAGNPDNIHIKASKGEKKPTSAEQPVIAETLQFEIVDYSEKAIALFGDTKEIKDLLKTMGGKFNPRLVYKGSKRAGWIFSISKKNELNTVLNLKQK